MDDQGRLTREKQKAVNKIGHGKIIVFLRAPLPPFKFLVKDWELFECFLFLFAGLHELDPAFREVTLENQRLKALVRDLQFHKDPVGKCAV